MRTYSCMERHNHRGNLSRTSDPEALPQTHTIFTYVNGDPWDLLLSFRTPFRRSKAEKKEDLPRGKVHGRCVKRKDDGSVPPEYRGWRWLAGTVFNGGNEVKAGGKGGTSPISAGVPLQDPGSSSAAGNLKTRLRWTCSIIRSAKRSLRGVISLVPGSCGQ